MAITISGSGIVEANIADGAVSSDKLATGIDATKLADGTITNSELQYINSLSSNAQTQISAASTTLAPYYSAQIWGVQDVSDAVTTKVAAGTENNDSDGCYDNATYRFTPTTAGRYFVMANIQMSPNGANRFHNCQVFIYKNGGNAFSISEDDYPNYYSYSKAMTLSQIINMNGSTDYIEFYANLNVTTGSPRITGVTMAYFVGA
jgi:hypothetical protein